MSGQANLVPGVIPYLCIKGAAQAIDVSARALGADERTRSAWSVRPRSGAAPVSFMISARDLAAMVSRAIAAGGTLTRPVENRFYGYRNGEISDPFGYRWTLSARIEDVSEEEVVRRAAQDEKKRRAGAD